MNHVRFETLTKIVSQKISLGAAAAAVAGLIKQGGVAAQDIASAGNGGVATASANGGAVALGDINSGGNVGNAVAAGDSWGPVAVDGGVSTSATNVDISANGGVAIADASGGDSNFAFVS